MKRNLRALGLLLVASFAISAFTASAAQAAPEFSVGESATIRMTPAVFGNNLVTKIKGIETITCKELTAEGELEGVSIAVTAKNIAYTTCDANAGKNPVTVNVNGCEYKFTVTKSLGGEEFSGVIHLVCPTAKGIEFTVYSGTPHTTAICTFEVGEQTISSVTYKNVSTTGGLKILTATIDGKVNTSYSGTACGTGSNTGIEFTSDLFWHAENKMNNTIDLKIKNTP
jgi:hypothetical protein